MCRILFISFAFIYVRLNSGLTSVTGHLKTSQPGSNQNRPLSGGDFITDSRVYARDVYLEPAGTPFLSVAIRWHGSEISV